MGVGLTSIEVRKWTKTRQLLKPHAVDSNGSPLESPTEEISLDCDVSDVASNAEAEQERYRKESGISPEVLDGRTPLLRGEPPNVVLKAF